MSHKRNYLGAYGYSLKFDTSRKSRSVTEPELRLCEPKLTYATLSWPLGQDAGFRV